MQMPGRKTVAKIKMKKVSHTDLSCDFVQNTGLSASRSQIDPYDLQEIDRI